jgi:iron complex outermembrane receptor protein
VNANIAVAGHEDRWKISVYGQNLTNQTVMSGAVANGTAPILQFFQPPREFGVDLSFKF